MALSNSVEPDIDRSLRRTILLAVFVIVFPAVLFFVSWLVGNGRLELSLPGDGKTYAVQIINQKDGKELSSITTKASKAAYTLPSGGYEVRVFSDDKRASSYIVSVPRLYKTVNRGVSVQNQVSREKLGRGIMSCPVYSGSVLYSYTCGFSASLARHTPLTSAKYSERVYTRTEGLIAASAYQDGVLVLRLVNTAGQGRQVFVELMKKDKVTASQILPTSLSEDRGSSADFRLIVDQTNKDTFVVIRKDAGITWAHFTNMNSQPIVKALTESGLNVSEMATSFTLREGRLSVAYGESGHGHHDDEESPAKGKSSKTHIKIVQAASGDTQTEFEVDDPFLKFDPCGEFYCLLQEGGLKVFRAEGDKLALAAEYNHVDDFLVTAGGEVVFKQANSIYGLNPSDLSTRLMFLSDNFTLSSIHPSDGGILVNAHLSEDRATSTEHVFLLDVKPASTNTFPDQKLPYAKGIIDNLVDMDYTGKNILSTVILRSARVTDGGRAIVYNKAEFKRVTAAVTTRLNRDGFSSPDYKIGFLVSY